MLRMILLSLLITTFLYGTADKKPVKEAKPLVQVAILLDTSNSMDGLINQAKGQLWKIVSDLATGKYKGQSVDIEVALYEYGNDSLSIQTGYIRKVSEFTNNLDQISELLFGLRTNGGSEYCGHVVDTAVGSLKWRDGKDTLRMIYIAGNEPFTQGSVNYITAGKKAISKGIIVNTIFCGNYQEGIRTSWKNGAIIADGSYLNIDQDYRAAKITTPYDDKILKLEVKLNATYIPYGRMGHIAQKNQIRQDKNMAKFGSSNRVQRAVFKSKKQYSNSSWDLVDAIKNGKMTIDKVEVTSLPKNMQTMSTAKRKSYVETQMKNRATVQKEIVEIQKKRAVYVQKEEKKKGVQKEKTMNYQMKRSLKSNKAIESADFEF